MEKVLGFPFLIFRLARVLMFWLAICKRNDFPWKGYLENETNYKQNKVLIPYLDTEEWLPTNSRTS